MNTLYVVQDVHEGGTFVATEEQRRQALANLVERRDTEARRQRQAWIEARLVHAEQEVRSVPGGV